jgi:hypothetical protein
MGLEKERFKMDFGRLGFYKVDGQDNNASR